eukprot:578195-Rhodomonas_salina.2
MQFFVRGVVRVNFWRHLQSVHCSGVGWHASGVCHMPVRSTHPIPICIAIAVGLHVVILIVGPMNWRPLIRIVTSLFGRSMPAGSGEGVNRGRRKSSNTIQLGPGKPPIIAVDFNSVPVPLFLKRWTGIRVKIG